MYFHSSPSCRILNKQMPFLIRDFHFFLTNIKFIKPLPNQRFFFPVYVSHGLTVPLVLLRAVGLARAMACPKCTVHMLIDLKHNFKKCESIFQFLNKMQLCSVSPVIYCVGTISMWCHHYCNIEGSGKCSIVFSLILKNWITSINLPGKGVWFQNSN